MGHVKCGRWTPWLALPLCQDLASIGDALRCRRCRRCGPVNDVSVFTVGAGRGTVSEATPTHLWLAILRRRGARPTVHAGRECPEVACWQQSRGAGRAAGRDANPPSALRGLAWRGVALPGMPPRPRYRTGSDRTPRETSPAPARLPWLPWQRALQCPAGSQARATPAAALPRAGLRVYCSATARPHKVHKEISGRRKKYCPIKKGGAARKRRAYMALPLPELRAATPSATLEGSAS